jgi:hypothetical protein
MIRLTCRRATMLSTPSSPIPNWITRLRQSARLTSHATPERARLLSLCSNRLGGVAKLMNSAINVVNFSINTNVRRMRSRRA